MKLLRILCTCLYAGFAGPKTSAAEYIFNGFSSTNNLTLNGNAFVTNTADGTVIRLVGTQTWQSGSVFSTLPIAASTYSASFKFRITNAGGLADPTGQTGADGIAFLVQAITNSIGASGGSIGYGGISHSVDVEFDTWENTGYNDPSSNHLGINTNGVVDHGIGSLYTATMSPDFDDGHLWYAWVDYDGSNVEVRANETGIRPQTANLTRPLNVVQLLGQTNAYVGFTAGTGLAWENIDLIYLDYRDKYNPIMTTNYASVFINAGVQIGWSSATNANYQVQRASKVDTNTWSNLGGLIKGNGSTNYFFDAFGGYLDMFYRVLIIP